MSIERFCRKRVVTAQPDESAFAVARRMRDEHVGCVVIVELGRPVGIVTDRDLVSRVLAERRSPEQPIRDFMTAAPVTVRAGDQLDHVVSRMREAGVRRLPITDAGGALVGLVSLDDVNVLLAGELNAAVEAIQDNRGP